MPEQNFYVKNYFLGTNVAILRKSSSGGKEGNEAAKEFWVIKTMATTQKPPLAHSVNGDNNIITNVIS